MPPELMQLLSGGGGTEARGMPPQSPEVSQAPITAPMSGPEPMQGDKQEAMIQIQMAVDLLERSLPAIGSETPQGRAIMSTLSSLSKEFGEMRTAAKELMPAEIMQLMSSLPQAGGASPAMKAMQGGGAGGPPGGGMPPGGMPPMPGGMPGAM